MAKADEHAHPNYIKIFVYLVVLTALEVMLAWIMPGQAEGPSAWRTICIIAMVGMAIAKAGLVAMFFMHLKFEPLTLIVVVLFPMVLAILMAAAVMPDAMWEPAAIVNGTQ